MTKLLTILTLGTLLSESAWGQQAPCKKPDYGKWDLDFQDKELEDYTIWFKLDTFTQFLKNGKEKRGQLQWDKSNCTFTLTFDKTPQDSTAVEIWIVVDDIKDKPKTAKFRMTPKGNLHVTLGEGKMKKQDTHIVLY